MPGRATNPELPAQTEGVVFHRTGLTDATGIVDLTTWPAGMRLIIRKERPHPGAQLRFTDTDGLRLTASATNSVRGQVHDLEFRPHRRARCEDRIRVAKDTGLSNLPLHGFDQNRIWLAIVQLALDLTAWTQLLGFTDFISDGYRSSVTGRTGRSSQISHGNTPSHFPNTF